MVAPTTDEYELQQLVKTMKQMMRNEVHKSGEELVMIDAIQRLGLEFYFQEEIDAVLAKHHGWLITTVENNTSLHDLALRFRLLRQQGYNVPAAVFGKFMDSNGKFDPGLKKDLKGLMNLFEACQVSVPGEQILEDGSEFSRHCLQVLIHSEQQPTAEFIRNTLSCPHYKSLPRFMAKNNLHSFKGSLNALHDIDYHCNKWITELQELARIDITLSKINYQTEINRISKWWNKLGLTEELKDARSQPEKWHIWSTFSLPGPDMADQREDITKAISFVHIIDDIFDVYGTIEELGLFTEAVNNWKYENVEGLPQYMKITLKALFDTVDKMSAKIYDKYGGHPKECLQNAWAELCNAFLVEAKWFQSGNYPKSEEYLQNGIISTGVCTVCACIFLLAGEGKHCGNKDTVDIASLSAKILRLWDDLGCSKDENQNGHDGSFIECYVNEHDGCSTQKAREYVHSMIAYAWKLLNQACLFPSPHSTIYKTAILNVARMVPVMYSYDINHRLPKLENHINTLLVSEGTDSTTLLGGLWN